MGDSEEMQNTFISLLSILSIASVLTNLFCINIIRRTKKLMKRTSTYFILNLLFVQLYQSLIVIPFYAAKKYKFTSRTTTQLVCDGFRFNYMVSYYAGVLSVFLIATDRLIATRFVWKYKLMASHRKALFLILLMWLYVVSLCLIPFEKESDGNKSKVLTNGNITVQSFEKCYYRQTRVWSVFMLIANCMVPYMLIIVWYKLISSVVKKFDARKKRRESDIMLNVTHNVKIENEERNSVTTLTIILAVTYLLLWGPSVIYNILWAFCTKSCFPDSFKSHPIETYVGFLTKYVAFFDTLAAPLIYCFYHDEFRKLLRKHTVERILSHRKGPMPLLIDMKTFDNSKETDV